jgi:O-antigen/teichoic acid export membrane protein
VYLVEFSEMNRRGEPLRDRYLQVLALTTASLWPAFAGMAVIARPLIVFLYGSRWVPATHAFQLLCVASMIWVSITMTWELFTATGRLSVQTKIETIRSAVGLAAFVGASFISLEAVAATRIIDAVLAALLYRRHVHTITETDFRDVYPVYSASAFLTCLAIGPSVLLPRIVGDQPSVPWILTGILSGSALWLIGLACMKHPLYEQVLQILQAMKRQYVTD